VGSAPSPEECRGQLVEAVGDDAAFVSATFTGAIRGATPPTTRITVRPVDLTTGRHLQFSDYDGRSTTVTNLAPADGVRRFAELLDAGFGTVYVKTVHADLQLIHSKKGVPRLVTHRPTATAVDTSHDRSKRRILDEHAPFLQVVGITDDRARVKPTARAKYRQVERFIEIVEHTLPGPDGLAPGASLRAVDLGCGSGVLTLATYHYLSVVRGLHVTMTGVDTNAELIARLDDTAASLGWDGGLAFRAGTIDTFEPDEPPELVLALHACDTATDDALARAVTWQSNWVLAAPCCQHDLQAQIESVTAPAGYEPLLRHGIVRERLGDLLTDSLRSEILRAHGYRTDVIEFVSTEHTGKNLMIRAVRTGRLDETAAGSAEQLADLWQVQPALARRVGYRPAG
jgi:SAM-dependent methyltransferase